MGSSSLAEARPSTVVTSCPSAWTANIVQLFTGLPSNKTVHAPQFVVSQPKWVPVKPRACRTKWTSSSLGSTSRVCCLPLTVTVSRRPGVSADASSDTTSNRLVISSRLSGRELKAREDSGYKRGNDMTLICRTASMIGPRLRYFTSKFCSTMNGLRVQILADK